MDPHFPYIMEREAERRMMVSGETLHGERN